VQHCGILPSLSTLDNIHIQPIGWTYICAERVNTTSLFFSTKCAIKIFTVTASITSVSSYIYTQLNLSVCVFLCSLCMSAVLSGSARNLACDIPGWLWATLASAARARGLALYAPSIRRCKWVASSSEHLELAGVRRNGSSALGARSNQALLAGGWSDIFPHILKCCAKNKPQF